VVQEDAGVLSVGVLRVDLHAVLHRRDGVRAGDRNGLCGQHVLMHKTDYVGYPHAAMIPTTLCTDVGHGIEIYRR
ncbi:MAG: hypothetical protein IKE16_12385, partial [Solobacterium sp.]|nr:hypothetical protein [Solobacterium sp.]